MVQADADHRGRRLSQQLSLFSKRGQSADAASNLTAAEAAAAPETRRGSAPQDKGKLFAGWRESLAAMLPSSSSKTTKEGDDTVRYKHDDDDDDDDADHEDEDASSHSSDATSSTNSAHAGPSHLPRPRRMTRNRSASLPSSVETRQPPPRFNIQTGDDDGGGEQGTDVKSFVPPSALVRFNSTTPSLRMQASSRQQQSRGFAWRADENGKGNFVPPSHRNPTALQAFYDTHFGSSSNWRTIRRPFSGAASMWNKHNPLSKKRDKAKSVAGAEVFASDSIAPEAGNADETEQEGERPKTLASRLGLLSIAPSIFGLGPSSSVEDRSKEERGIDPNTYEPELIPTTHSDPLASYYFKRLEGNVVVIGGYRGSVLRDAATNQMLWVPLKVGVGLRRPTLELGLDEEAEDNSEDLVYADEILSEIGSMVDSGKRLMQRCSTKRTHVYSFGYDWRLSLARSSKRLEAFLYRLWEESATDPKERKGAKVIAHSMGGLVTLHALSQSKTPQIFESIVFASTPFLGTPNILGPLRIGDAALFNEEICSPKASFTFRSTFYLLPTDHSNREDHRCTAGGQCFEEEDGTPHDIDFLSPDTWNELGFSPVVEAGTRPKLVGNGQGHGLSAGAVPGTHIEANASAEQAQNAEKAERVPALPGADLQMTASDNHEGAHIAEGIKDAVKAGQELALEQDDTEEALLPENRQKDGARTNISDDEAQASLIAKWQYLERTLAEVKQFVYDLRSSFDESRFQAGEYPPMAILTSGRTPTVRGALTWPYDGGDGSPADHWKETVRRGDYSRMLYAPGDGVILRRSSVTMPGQWGRCLVRGSDDAAKDEATIAAVRSLSKSKRYDELDKLDLNLTSSEGTVETSHRHVTLLSDVNGIGRCLEATRRARRSRS